MSNNSEASGPPTTIEDVLRLLINTTPSFIHTALPDGALDFLDQSWLEFVGLSLTDLLGWRWTSAMHPDDVEEFVGKWRASVASGEPFVAESRVRRADGAYRWFLHRKVPLRDENGKIIKWYGSSIEIEERKQAEEGVRKENIVLREQIVETSMFEEIVGTSSALQAILLKVEKVAPTDSTVLITGETGTGKELIARAIHKRSTRSNRAFVSVNCAAVPTSLIASELFGHEKGAFTGAAHRREGRFELSDGGTIFLDEVGELPPEVQEALLRVLQEREFERVGGNRPLRANVRVIAATNRDLETAIEGNKFRSDLYYRLNVFPVEMPPLRERRDDIPLLVEYFTQRFSKRIGKRISRISNETMSVLLSYDWPGNVREMQNVVERAVILSNKDTLDIDRRWLARRQSRSVETIQKPPRTLVHQTPAAREKDTIEAALGESKGRVSGPFGAASRLGIPSSTLESKIKALKIDKRRFKQQ